MQSEAKVHVTGNVYRHNPHTHNIGKTHLISQRLSLNMPRLNQNQRLQALTMLARGDNVSNVSRAFGNGCYRKKIIGLRQRFQQTAGVADRHRPGRPRVTNPQTDRFHYADAPSTSFSKGDKFCKAVRYQQTDSIAPPQASPATHSAKGTLCGTSAYSKSSGYPFAVGTTALQLGATAVCSGSIL